jgi:GntR family transcriptional regulator/MocR family aminotransferase
MKHIAGEHLYAHLYACIKHDIVQGTLKSDEKLPSKRSLAQHLGVSLVTVEHAYSQLIAEGYIRAKEKSGYFINQINPTSLSLPATPSDIAHQTSVKPYMRTQTDNDALSEHKITLDFVDPPIDVSSFPSHEWSHAMHESLNKAGDSSLLCDTSGQGLVALRTAIAQHIRRYRGLAIDPSRIVIGAGAQYLYGLIIQLLGRNRHYAIEDPGYRRLANIYQANNVELSYVPLDQEGISVAQLEAAKADVAHVMPSHQLPTGITMPISRRYELLAWACKSPERIIIEDDYDCEFRLAGQPIPTLQSVDARDRVIYINTFTKSLAPGIRIAYMVLPHPLMQRFNRYLGFYSCTVSVFEQYALARFIEQGSFERHLNRTRKRCKEVRDRAIAAIDASSLGKQCTLSGCDSGLHFLMHIQGAATEHELVKTSAQAGIRIQGINSYRQYTHPDSIPTLLINYAGFSTDTIEPAIAQLAKALSTCLQ